MQCAGKAASGAPGRVRVAVMAAEAEDLRVCWICLDGPSLDRPLVQPCRCPSMAVHDRCLARWQLQSAGTRRERYCDFCASELPDWKHVLTPSAPVACAAPAVMNVNFDNKTYSFHVAPGADGYRQFTEAIRRAFSLPQDSELNITFTCDEPSTGSLLTLSGPGAYDAAVHCASVSAARRSISSPDSSGGAAAADGEHQQLLAGDAVGTAAPGEHPAGAEEQPQEPPTTPRLADRQRWQQQHQAPRPSTAGSSASSGSGSRNAVDATRLQRLAVEHLLQEDADAASNSSSSNAGSRSSSRGRGERGPPGGNGLVRSFGGSRSSSGASLASEGGAGGSSAMHGCGPAGAASSSVLAEAERHSSGALGVSRLSRASSYSSSSSARQRGGGVSLGRKLREALADLLTSNK